MRFCAIAAASLALIPALSLAEPRPYMRAFSSANQLLGLMKRQGGQPGYAPTSTPCTGTGTTCAEVCGTGQEQCPSNDGNLHCFDPTAGQVCCTDGSGCKSFS
jgi:hypothetical protein